MDIYEYAESINYAVDYIDSQANRIFKITEAKEHGGKIPIIQDDMFMGFAKRKEKY